MPGVAPALSHPDLPSRTEELVSPALAMCCLTAVSSAFSRNCPWLKNIVSFWGEVCIQLLVKWEYKDLTLHQYLGWLRQASPASKLPRGLAEPFFCVTAASLWACFFFLCPSLSAHLLSQHNPAFFPFPMDVDPTGVDPMGIP